MLDDVELMLSPTITTSSSSPHAVAGVIVLDDVVPLLCPTITTSSIEDDVETLLRTGSTSCAFLESFLHCAIASTLLRSVILPDNPDSPNAIVPVYNCGLPQCNTVLARASVLLCVNAHMRS